MPCGNGTADEGGGGGGGGEGGGGGGEGQERRRDPAVVKGAEARAIKDFYRAYALRNDKVLVL
jgi:hypothetical protein